MPRSSSSSRSSSSYSHAPAKLQVPPPYAVTPFRPSTPTTGQMLKEGIVSGVGSGIGLGIGTRIASSLFGAPVVAVEKVGSAVAETKTTVNTFAQTTLPNLQQCQHNAFDVTEKPLCYALLSADPRHHEFKQCMDTSDNQIHVCKEFLPKE